jgi:pimeloyl-ACP methyl ester carboxylesterase
MNRTVPKFRIPVPFPALEGHFIEGPHGIPLYVESHGDPAARAKIMLVHGGLQSSLCYCRQVVSLAGQGCYVIALDLPWHGFSGPGPEQQALNPSPEILSESVAAVRAHFGLQEEPLTLLGWSFGGQVIRAYLLQQHPHNISGLVFVAALLDFESFTPTATGEYLQAVQLFQRLVTPATPMADRHQALQGFVDRLWHRPPSAEEYYRVLGYNFRSFAAGERVLDVLVYGTQAPGDLQQALREVACPILFVQGQRDALIPPVYTRQLAQMLPPEQVRLLEFPDCGHSPFLERSDAFNAAVLDFLGGPVRQFVAGRASLPT